MIKGRDGMRCVDRHGFEFGIWKLSGLTGMVEGGNVQYAERRGICMKMAGHTEKDGANIK